MTTDILQQILATKRAEVSSLNGAPDLEPGAIVAERRDFDAALRRPGIGVIAEIKRRSPSRGDIAPSIDPFLLAAAYESGGAVAISCLTDQAFFGALPADLPAARRGSSIPILRKDFIIDERQIHQSAATGADAILLIARCLTATDLQRFITVATQHQLAVLVEAHDEREIESSVDAGATLIGINNRDLRTFEVSLENAVRLRDRIPSHCVAVAESGIHTAEDVRRMADAGFDAVLVGESLVRSPDPTAAIRKLLGRHANLAAAGGAA